MISINNLTKSFASRVLFDSVSFNLNPKERVGIVGRNGHGKTTLFQIIMGKEDFESGEVRVPKDYSIGWVEQNLKFSQDNVLKEGCLGLPLGEEDEEWRAEKILTGLGFLETDLLKDPGELSGGYQVRLNLAKVLLRQPDLLLLDEPNNFLDIISIRWLERFLQNWPGELLLITHDRNFMDSVITHTLAIHRKKFRKISGSTEKLYLQIAQEEVIYEKTRVNDEKRKKDMEIFIRRFRAKARLGGLVQSRVKTLSKMEKKDKLEEIKNLDFSFKYKPFNGKYLMSATNLSFGYENDLPLFENLSLSVRSRDRIFVIGKNGKGKTTLLKILAGELESPKAEISIHTAVTRGYYEQSNVKGLSDSRTVLDEISASSPYLELQTARSIAGAMMFSGDDALKKIKLLSGGEKSRVMLGKLLATPANLLLLDEPTNHLDIQSCDALLEALDNYEGAIIMVTHNEMLLHALASRLVVFQNGQASVFEGSYSDFLEKNLWQEEEAAPISKEKNSKEKIIKLNKLNKTNKKKLRKNRSKVISNKSKVLKPLADKITEIEKEIKERELDQEKINQSLITASEKKLSSEITTLFQSLHFNKKKIEDLYNELDNVTRDYEGQSSFFEKELSLIGTT